MLDSTVPKSYPNGGPTYTYGFDSLGRAVSLTDNNGQSWINTEIYGADDQPIKMNIYNGSSYWIESRSYDPRGQLKTQSVPGVMDMTYVHSSSNDNGQITQSIDNMTGQTVNYTYDSLRRLTAATTGSTGPWAFSFSYDGFGNRTAETLTQGKGPSVTVGYDSTTNHISSTGFGYDANGNLSNMPNGITLGYDAENRLSSYYDPNQGTEFYGYGPQNHRVWKKEPSGNEEIHFFAPNGNHLGTYKPVVTSGTLSLQTIDTDLHYVNRSIRSRGNTVLRDRLGSVRAWGATVTHSYFPFGEEQSATASDHDKFATYYRDQTTGIDFARNRYYNSTYGAFLTADPKAASAHIGNPGSWNRYTYAGNDPVNSSDPSGMDPNDFASSTCSDPQILALCQAGDFWDYTGGSVGVYGPASVGGTPTSEPSGDPFGQSLDSPAYVDNGGSLYGNTPGPTGYTTIDGNPAAIDTQITFNGPAENAAYGGGMALIANAISNLGVPNAWSISGTLNLAPVGALIGGLVGGPAGVGSGAAIGSMFGGGLNVSYIPSSGTLYLGPTLSFTPVPGAGSGLVVSGYFFPYGQDPNATLNGWSTSVNIQTSLLTGTAVTNSPGQPSVVSISPLGRRRQSL